MWNVLHHEEQALDILNKLKQELVLSRLKFSAKLLFSPQASNSRRNQRVSLYFN